MAVTTRLERATGNLVGTCSILLSYAPVGAPLIAEWGAFLLERIGLGTQALITPITKIPIYCRAYDW